jgi:hypothetical protein
MLRTFAATQLNACPLIITRESHSNPTASTPVETEDISKIEIASVAYSLIEICDGLHQASGSPDLVGTTPLGRKHKLNRLRRNPGDDQCLVVRRRI